MTIGSPLALARTGTGAGLAALIAFWIGPAALVATIFFRTHAVVFLFMTECAALLAHAVFVGNDSGSAGFAMARLGLVASVAILGLAFLSRDVSMPFFVAGRRGFRGASRLKTNGGLRLSGENMKDLVAELEDCSLVGLAISIGAGGGDAPPLRSGELLEIVVRTDGVSHALRGTVAWCVRAEILWRAGISTTDVETMAKVIKDLTLRAVPPHRAAVARLAASTSLTRTALALWVGCMGGLAAIPACGTPPAMDVAAPPSPSEVGARPSVAGGGAEPESGAELHCCTVLFACNNYELIGNNPMAVQAKNQHFGTATLSGDLAIEPVCVALMTDVERDDGATFTNIEISGKSGTIGLSFPGQLEVGVRKIDTSPVQAEARKNVDELCSIVGGCTAEEREGHLAMQVGQLKREKKLTSQFSTFLIYRDGDREINESMGARNYLEDAKVTIREVPKGSSGSFVLDYDVTWSELETKNRLKVKGSIDVPYRGKKR